MEHPNMSILERIHASYYQLTATEKKVADYVLAHSSQVQFMSITQLADECGTADASISRFCRSLKLKGFNAFKLELAQHSAGTAKAQEQSTDTPSRSQEIRQLAIEAVSQTIDLAEPQKVLQAVELFEKAPRVFCFGAGGSYLMAQEFAHLFSTVSAKFTAIPDSHMQMSAVATMGQQDVIVLFSYSGATNGGIQLLELAKSRGIRTVLVTRFSKSPAAKLADVVLCCGSNEGPYQFGSVPAKIAQLVVIDYLFQEYYCRNQEACDENRYKIGAVLADMHI